MLTQSDKDTFISILEGNTEPDPYSKRIKENYHFFKEQILQSNIEPNMLYRGIRKLIIVDISLDQNYDNPQLIFESLNSTGVDLSQADLIRNYVLMGLDNDAQIKLYKNYWFPMEQRFLLAEGIRLFDRFMRDYLTLAVKKSILKPQPSAARVYSQIMLMKMR